MSLSIRSFMRYNATLVDFYGPIGERVRVDHGEITATGLAMFPGQQVTTQSSYYDSAS